MQGTELKKKKTTKGHFLRAENYQVNNLLTIFISKIFFSMEFAY